MWLFSGSFLCTSQPLAIWIVCETEQSAVAVEIPAICSALFPFVYRNMCIDTSYAKLQLLSFPFEQALCYLKVYF